MPKYWGVTLTWPRPRPFGGKLLARPLVFSKRKLCTIFEVSTWSYFEDMFDCMPKSLGVTWPGPRPFGGKLFERPLGFSKRKLCTKFEVSSSSCFEDMFDRIPKILGVTWPRPRPLWGKFCIFAYFYSSLPRSSCVTNLKCLRSLSLVLRLLLPHDAL